MSYVYPQQQQQNPQVQYMYYTDTATHISTDTATNTCTSTPNGPVVHAYSDAPSNHVYANPTYNPKHANWKLIKKRAGSSRNVFTCMVAKEIFTLNAMMGHNCAGWLKPKLDPAKLLAVQEITLHHFPCLNNEEDMTCRLCEKAIDTMIRNEAYRRRNLEKK
jgi:hypothetical protein